ncbi:MAG TPA: HAMP domain-containing sensor histidine kinase [Thermodesulfovibrionia bacterium]|nr:HAMP domain-containing sensor histidine kinase [Thermodesulfovibrionia bacterium]
MLISNEQLNTIRQAIKGRSNFIQAKERHDATWFDEISRLNNELINLQRQLSQKNAELERLNAQKNYFLAMAAHDLRNLISAIIMSCGIVYEVSRPFLTNEDMEFINIIQSTSKLMGKLVDNFLDISIIESGKLKLLLLPTNLISLIDDTVKLNQILAQQKQIKLFFYPCEPLPDIVIDGPKIDQVINNLISNAIKYSPKGSVVEIRLTCNDQEAVISVKDEGPGIFKADYERLFIPFERIGTKTTGGEKSTGIGLAIVKTIVRIWLESESGHGATFYVALPRTH